MTEMKFREWLRRADEAATTTADVSAFARPTLPGPVRRRWFGPWGADDPFFSNLNKKKKPVDPKL